MSMCAVNMQKYGAGSLGGLQSHNQREHESKKNHEIDPERSYLNHDLLNCENINYQAAVKKRIAALNLKKAVRKDAVVYCSFIVSSDRDFFELLAYKEHVRRENQDTAVAIGLREPSDFDLRDQDYKDDCMAVATDRFFKEAVKFFQRRYGKENIVNATVHLDEPGAPHMHLGLVPVIDGRLSAKKLFTPETLRKLQTDFAAEVGDKFGLQRGREGSTAKHLDEVTFKLQKRQEALKGASSDLHAANMEYVQVQESVEALRAEEADLKTKKEQGISTLSKIQEQITEKREELALTERALKRANEQGARQFGMAEWMRRIEEDKAQDRQKKQQEARLSLLERFVALPQIKPIWEQFCALVERGKEKKRSPDQPVK